MWLNTNDNTVIKKAVAITVDGVTHPKTIFSKWSEAELNAINIYKIVVIGSPDRKNSNVSEVDDFEATPPTRTYVNADDLAKRKARMFKDINDSVKALQAPFDVDYMKNLKGRKPVPQSVQSAVDDIYGKQDAKELAVTNFTTVAECIAYENEAYDYTITAEDVANDIDGSLVEGTIVSRIRNNLREW